ncbi:triphosphoribosyl-dephospho-CoA synthase [Streptomyces sp. NPDC059740]|uniref:triphosphoribosyl-dephospho-CoA synthase n=1 Tax=Streptomyces sp. NPDC059740 TaxID=3346926 RepID=UPI003662D135
MTLAPPTGRPRPGTPPQAAPSAEALADAAHAALVAEAELTPKPGLVDARGGGAHHDMDLALLRASAGTLRDGFAEMARAAHRHGHASQALREELAALGRAAEARMMVTTGGVNTHRGAIWALGLLVAGAALPPGRPSAREVAARAAAIARHPDTACPADAARTHGAAVHADYGVHGARGQARAAFPHVTDVALPALRAARSAGATTATARLDALLALMARLDDTCVLHRGGPAGLATVQQGARRVLAAGGAATPSGRTALAALDEQLRTERLSPGGCADLLAATLLLDGLDGAGRHSGRQGRAVLGGLGSHDEHHGPVRPAARGGPAALTHHPAPPPPHEES